MSLYVLTEMITVDSPTQEWGWQVFRRARWSPGLVDGEYARREMGDRYFDRMVTAGVLEPIP